MADSPYSDGAAIPTHWLIVVGVAVIVVLVGAIVLSRRIDAKRGLDKNEMAVLRQAAPPLFIGNGSVVVPLLLLLAWFGEYRHRVGVRKLLGFDPREQNRAEGVIFCFYELRITRSELIRGYEKTAQRIPLRGLTAAVTKTRTVDIAIEGPDTKFVYSEPDGAAGGSNPREAQQFAALLNYEASLQTAPY
jgi:hypothetical protein